MEIVRISEPLLITILPEPAFIASLNVKTRFAPARIFVLLSAGEDDVNVGAISSVAGVAMTATGMNGLVSITIGFATVVNTNALGSLPENAFPAISLSVPAASLTL